MGHRYEYVYLASLNLWVFTAQMVLWGCFPSQKEKDGRAAAERHWNTSAFKNTQLQVMLPAACSCCSFIWRA